eukprot:gene6532-9978_t
MNNYQIYEEIGRGRHSTVYKGRLKKSVEYYAIKSVDKAQRSRVLNEVTMLHQLCHPNILHFFHWYETNNHLWLIEEYCTGSDVFTLIKQDNSLPEETLATFASDLLAALNFIHSRGIIYCDLKPSNILIDAHGFLKLSDFGLACHIDDVTPGKRKIGTPSYMAPEVFVEGGVLSFATDLWALGIVLYEIFVGVPPFADQKLDALIQKIVYSDYQRPTGGSAGLLEVLEGLLQKDPLERAGWAVLGGKEFWKEKKVLPVPQQPAFEAYKARRRAEGNATKAEAKERGRRQVAKISATAQINLVREQQGSTYDRKEEGADSGFELDTEVDFGAGGAVDDDDLQDEGKDVKDEPPASLIQASVQLPPQGSRPSSPPGAPPQPRAEPAADVPPAPAEEDVKIPEHRPAAPLTPSQAAQPATVEFPAHTPNDFQSLLFTPSDSHVKPIMCNTRVERLSEVKYDVDSLSFPAHTLQEVCSMSHPVLEAFLTSIYKALGGATTIGDKQNCLCYFETLCGATATANLFINSVLMTLFVKMVQNKSYPPGFKTRLCLVMGLLIRHATYIKTDLAGSGIVQALLSLLDDKSVKVKRRAVACAGELLFYIATQQPMDRTSWEIGPEVHQAFCKALSSEDEVVRHYAVKTIENICGHSDGQVYSTYASTEVVQALITNFVSQPHSDKATKNEYLRSSAISSLSRICRVHPKSIVYILNELRTPGLLQGLASGSNTRTIQSSLNIINLLLCKICHALANLEAASAEKDEDTLLSFIDFTVPPNSKPSIGEHVFKTSILTEEDVLRLLNEFSINAKPLVQGLMTSLEHSSVVIRSKTLLGISLLTVIDLQYLNMCCDTKLPPLLEKISKEEDKYVVACFETFTTLLSAAVSLIVNRLKRHLIKRDPMEGIREQLAIVLHMLTTHSIRSSVISAGLLHSVSQCLQAAEPTSGNEESSMQPLLLMAEAMSQDASSMKRLQKDVIKYLLPVLTGLLESSYGDTRFVSLKIFIDVLVPFLQTDEPKQEKDKEKDREKEKLDQPTDDKSSRPSSINTLILNQLLPRLMTLLDDEEPIPLYGLKLLNSIATEDPAFVDVLTKPEWTSKLFAFFELEHRNNNVHNVKLVLKVVRKVPLPTVFELGVVSK